MTALRPRHLLGRASAPPPSGSPRAAASDDESSTSTTASQPNVARYCELVGQLDRASTEVFNQLDTTSPSKADLAAAQLQILNQNGRPDLRDRDGRPG